MNKMDLQAIAKDTEDISQFMTIIDKQTKPYRKVMSEDKGSFVRIIAKSYGRKSPAEFNMGIPKEGKIIKINKVSFTIENLKGDLYKVPMNSLISDDLGYLKEVIRLRPEELHNELKM